MTIRAYAAAQKGAALEAIEYDAGKLKPNEVEIAVDNCGICHSDLSMIDNDWQMAAYPFVPGHEIVGRIAAMGSDVPGLQNGARAGVGWFSNSCMACRQCLSGDHNLCESAQGTIIGRHGGFAERVRAHWAWIFPIPEGVDPAKAGPLFCGGVTVFNPLVQNGIQPMDRVGIVGIGGLGHMAIQFTRAWGCEVTAFSSSPEKESEARSMGAHHFTSSTDTDAIKKLARSFDMILVTANAPLDWPAYIEALKPKGKLHIVGAVPAVTTEIFPLLVAQRSIGSSPVGSPATTLDMLDFAARHRIEPMIETFPMSRVNDALEHLRSGKARYRIVLENDF